MAVCQPVCCIACLTRDGDTLQCLDELSSGTPFPCVPSPNAGAVAVLPCEGLVSARKLCCISAGGTQLALPLGWERNSLEWIVEQSYTFRPGLCSEGHSGIEVILISYFIQNVVFPKCQSVLSRMDHPFLLKAQPFGRMLVTHKSGQSGFIFKYLKTCW